MSSTPPETVEARELEPQLGRPRILLIEDDQAVREATHMVLKLEGYRVTAVASLGEALEYAARTEGLDLLVTDYHLGNGETGAQAITALRARLGTVLKAVLITGDASLGVGDLPADPHLRIANKPVGAGALLTLVRTLLAA